MRVQDVRTSLGEAMTDDLVKAAGAQESKPARYVWIVEDNEMMEACNTKEVAEYWQRQWQTWTPGSSPIITRFVAAPE